MYISQLKNKIDAYDKFGEHRTNGLKALFVLEILFIFNFIYTVPNPYFYYFYVPLTAFAAEIAGGTLKEKYLFLTFTLIGSTIAIFFFGVFSVYKLFFLFFVFGGALTIYYTAINKIRSMFVAAPLILSLAAYSLIYKNADSNLYVALNNALLTIVATLLILAGLYIFPKTYYLAIWRRAFCDVLLNLEKITAQIATGEAKTIPIFSGIIVMERYSGMLSSKMKCYSILKITLLTFELIMAMSYLISFQSHHRIHYVITLNKYCSALYLACKNRQPLAISAQELAVLNETYELRILQRLILSWNYLCLEH